MKKGGKSRKRINILGTVTNFITGIIPQYKYNHKTISVYDKLRKQNYLSYDCPIICKKQVIWNVKKYINLSTTIKNVMQYIIIHTHIIKNDTYKKHAEI